MAREKENKGKVLHGSNIFLLPFSKHRGVMLTKCWNFQNGSRTVASCMPQKGLWKLFTWCILSCIAPSLQMGENWQKILRWSFVKDQGVQEPNFSATNSAPYCLSCVCSVPPSQCNKGGCLEISVAKCVESGRLTALAVCWVVSCDRSPERICTGEGTELEQAACLPWTLPAFESETCQRK